MEYHRRRRHAIREGLDKGHFPDQIVAALGMDQPADWNSDGRGTPDEVLAKLIDSEKREKQKDEQLAYKDRIIAQKGPRKRGNTAGRAPEAA